MTHTKAQPSLVTTQRAGQALDADFCCWHAQLVDAELVAPCTPENCPLQQAQTDHGGVKNPALIVLRPGVTLADLKQAFSKRDWHLLKNSLPALRSALNQLVSKHPAGALPEKGAAQPNESSPHERGPGVFLAGISDFLTDTLVPSLAWIGLSKQETREALHSLLSDIGPSSSMQGQLLCNFVHSHFQGFSFFIDQPIVLPEEGRYIFKLSDTHKTGLKLLDLSLTYLNELAQLVRCEPLRLDLPQRRLQQKRLLANNELSVAGVFQETLAVSDNAAVELMLHPFIEALTPLGLTQKEETQQQIYSLLHATPSIEPIEALLKLQRLLLSLIGHRLGDPAFLIGEGPDRDQLLVRYHQALTRRDKALKNWCACRDGAAADPPML